MRMDSLILIFLICIISVKSAIWIVGWSVYCVCVSQGPKGEAVGSITQPLPSSHLIFRAASESDGKTHTQHTDKTERCILRRLQSLVWCVQADVGWMLLSWLWNARVCWRERWSERAKRRRHRPQSTRTSTSTVCCGRTTCRAFSKSTLTHWAVMWQSL